MKDKIEISFVLPTSTAKPWLRVEVPSRYHTEEPLKYGEDEVKGDWGRLRVRQWLMPGFCMLWESIEDCQDASPKLVIAGPHVAVICYDNGGYEDSGPEESFYTNPIPGTVEVRNSDRTILHSITEGNSQRVSIIFSLPTLSRLLDNESWIKAHPSYVLQQGISNKTSTYFLELPIRRILDAMINEQFNPSQKRHYFRLKLKELFFLLHLQEEISSIQSEISRDDQEKLIAAKAYLLANYRQAPTIRQLSRIVSLNEFKLKQFFKQLFGTTIKSYVISLRMEESRNLLANNYSVGDVASLMGYRNVSHFILIFKKTFGITPRQMMLRHISGSVTKQ